MAVLGVFGFIVRDILRVYLKVYEYISEWATAADFMYRHHDKSKRISFAVSITIRWDGLKFIKEVGDWDAILLVAYTNSESKCVQSGSTGTTLETDSSARPGESTVLFKVPV